MFCICSTKPALLFVFLSYCITLLIQAQQQSQTDFNNADNLNTAISFLCRLYYMIIQNQHLFCNGMSSIATARSQCHRKWHACMKYSAGKCQLTWNCQCDDITPLSWGIQVLSQLSHTPVVSTVGHSGASNPVFITCWDCVWVGTAPFILPLSVFILPLSVFIFQLKVYIIHFKILQLRVSMYVTSDCDHLTTKYKRPVGLQRHNSLVGNCEEKINRWNLKALHLLAV